MLILAFHLLDKLFYKMLKEANAEHERGIYQPNIHYISKCWRIP